jgi:hypothetical protein
MIENRHRHLGGNVICHQFGPPVKNRWVCPRYPKISLVFPMTTAISSHLPDDETGDAGRADQQDQGGDCDNCAGHRNSP